MAMLPEEDKYGQTKEELLAFIDVAMGGRVAEELIYGNDDITTGCSSDLSKASQIAYEFVRSYGMGDSKFLIASKKKDLSEATNYKIDQEVQQILKVVFELVRILTAESRNFSIKTSTNCTVWPKNWPKKRP